MIDKYNIGEIRAQSCPVCYVCGSIGKMLYHDLRDRIFGTPGEWNVRKCSNSKCGLMWLDPMPVKEDIGNAYQNYYTHWEDTPNFRNVWLRKVYALIKEGYLAHKYGYYIESVAMWKRFFGMVAYFHPGRRADLDSAVMYLPAKPSGRLLEVGCGGGNMLKLMQNMEWCVEGVDFDRSAVENAKSKGLKVHVGTLGAQKYPENHFDAIIMSHLVEHVHDPLGLLEESHRILKPGGYLVIMTPNGRKLGAWTLRGRLERSGTATTSIYVQYQSFTLSNKKSRLPGFESMDIHTWRELAIHRKPIYSNKRKLCCRKPPINSYSFVGALYAVRRMGHFESETSEWRGN